MFYFLSADQEISYTELEHIRTPDWSRHHKLNTADKKQREKNRNKMTPSSHNNVCLSTCVGKQKITKKKTKGKFPWSELGKQNTPENKVSCS